MASPLGHSVAGIGIYWLSLQKRSAPEKWFKRKELYGLMAAVVLANLADFDLIAGVLAGRYMHSQITHTPVFAVMIGLIAAAVAPFFHVKPFRAFWLVTLLVGSHIVVDFFTRDTSYPVGNMLFWPVSNRYYISPVSIFPDIWRGSPALIFGFNNINAALREITVGGLFLLAVNRFSKLPCGVQKYLPTVTVVAGVLAIVLHYPLTTLAQRQMAAFWGDESGITDEQITRGILFSAKTGDYSDIYRMQPDGTGLTRLTNTQANDTMPVWSPDGQRIAFQSDRAGKWDIWVMAADGSGKTNLTERSDSSDESPAWTARGNQIVFSSDRDGSYELFIMARNGRSIKRVTDYSPETKVLPAVSPVKGTVAYTVNNPAGPGWRIFIKSLNRGASREISPEFGCRAKWSPDGQQLCYVSESPIGKSDIYIFSVNEKDQIRVTYSDDYDYDPCFSPDGAKIVFSRGRNGQKNGWDLWIIDLDTGHEQRLTTNGMDNRYPSWR